MSGTPDPILEIIMQSRPGEGDPCVNCRQPSSGHHALPIFNGDIMSNEWPGEWGGVPCCERCYELHEQGKVSTADHLYRHLLAGLGHIDGSGI